MARCYVDDAAGNLEDEREEWAVGVEHALAELGERISLGGWLVGIRRMRMLRMKERAERAAAKRAQSSDVVTSRKDEGGSSSLRGKGAPAQPTHDEPGFFTLGRHSVKSAPTADGSQESQSTVSIEESLQTLRTQAALHYVPGPKPTAQHLLLTIAPPGHMPVIQQSDTEEYEFPHSQSSCIFLPGVFAMPQSADSAEDEFGGILFGLDSWTGE